MSTLRSLLVAPLALLVLAACQTTSVAAPERAALSLTGPEQPGEVALGLDASTTTVEPNDVALHAGVGLVAVSTFGVLAALLPIMLAEHPSHLPPSVLAPSMLTAFAATTVMVAGVGLLPFVAAESADPAPDTAADSAADAN